VQLVELEERHTRRTRDLAAFVHEVEGLAGTLRVEAEPEAIREALAADEAALHHAFARLDALIDARRHAEVVRREVARLQVQLAKEGEGAIGDAEQLAAVEQELSRLAAEAACGSDAGAADVADCVAHAERSAALRALDGELERLQRAFLVHSNGRSADEVRSELVDRDAATLQAAAHDVDERVRALVRERDELQRSVTELTTRVEGGSDADDAAILAAEIASVDAELVDAAQTFLRASLAKHLLDREVDAYRRETQGPLLERTQELFRELTLGAYVCLHPSERGKESVMVGRRPDDTTVHVEGMSTGTRDQLYLALRIASVEHKLTAIEPQPFIADDLFVNFDDARTAAALRVLAELGRRTQVIVFTHHDNVLAACEALTQDGVEVDVLRLPAEHVRFGARGGRSDEWSGAGGNGTEE
jgi:chromosome segregation protein